MTIDSLRLTETKPVSQLMMDLIDQINRLIRQELRLARAEASEKASDVTVGLIGVVGGLLVALAALLVLVQAVVVALAEYMPPSLAALVVGAVLAVVAFILIRSGQSKLSPENLALPKTAQSLKRDKDLVMETVQ